MIKIIKEKTKYKDGNVKKPIPSTVDILYHATNFQSSLYVAKYNKLRSSPAHHRNIRSKKGSPISLSTNIKYYNQHHVPISGRPIILWVLDYKTLKRDDISIQLNTSNYRNVDSYEVLVWDKELRRFNNYVLRTYVGEKIIEETYDFVIENFIEKLKTDRDMWVEDVTLKEILWGNFYLDFIPKNYKEFRDYYISKIEKRFGKIILVDDIRNLKGKV